MRHLIDPLDFTHQEICALLDLADRICADPGSLPGGSSPQKIGHLVLRAFHPHPPLL